MEKSLDFTPFNFELYSKHVGGKWKGQSHVGSSESVRVPGAFVHKVILLRIEKHVSK